MPSIQTRETELLRPGMLDSLVSGTACKGWAIYDTMVFGAYITLKGFLLFLGRIDLSSSAVSGSRLWYIAKIRIELSLNTFPEEFTDVF